MSVPNVCLALLVVISQLVVAWPASAVPTPVAQLADKRAELNRVQAALQAMDAKLEMLIEAYNKVQEEIDLTDKAIVRNQLELEAANRDLEHAQRLLNRRVVNIYRKAEVDVVGVMLGTSDFDDFLARVQFLARIGAADAEAKVSVELARNRVESIRRKLQQQRTRKVALRGDLAIRRDDVEGRLAAKRRYLTSLNAAIQKLIEEEKERQRRLAEALARKALAGKRPSWYPDPGQVYPRDKVVDVALAQLGKPYRWAATGPDSFDCSGLMLYCYAFVGVYLPRVSQDQARFGTPVSRDELEPGDLVYFGYGGDPNRVHHIGMYLGDGTFIHAPRTGDVIRIQYLSSRSDYAGATRP